MKAGEEEEARRYGQAKDQEKIQAYNRLRMLVRGDLDLRTAGFRDWEAAVRWTVESTDKRVAALDAEFLRKYPD